MVRLPEVGELLPGREGRPRVGRAVGQHGGHDGEVGWRAGVDLVSRDSAVEVRLVAVHLIDEAGELRPGVLGVGSEGELRELFPRRVVAGDVQRTDAQGGVLSH